MNWSTAYPHDVVLYWQKMLIDAYHKLCFFKSLSFTEMVKLIYLRLCYENNTHETWQWTGKCTWNIISLSLASWGANPSTMGPSWRFQMHQMKETDANNIHLRNTNTLFSMYSQGNISLKEALWFQASNGTENPQEWKLRKTTKYCLTL